MSLIAKLNSHNLSDFALLSQLELVLYQLIGLFVILNPVWIIVGPWVIHPLRSFNLLCRSRWWRKVCLSRQGRWAHVRRSNYRCLSGRVVLYFWGRYWLLERNMCISRRRSKLVGINILISLIVNNLRLSLRIIGYFRAAWSDILPTLRTDFTTCPSTVFIATGTTCPFIFTFYQSFLSLLLRLLFEKRILLLVIKNWNFLLHLDLGLWLLFLLFYFSTLTYLIWFHLIRFGWFRTLTNHAL